MKILKRVVEGRVRKFVRIDNMHYGFMAANGGGNFRASPSLPEDCLS